MEVREPSAKYLIKQTVGEALSWRYVRLGAVASFRTGPFGSALHKSDYVFGGVPVVNPMQIEGGRIKPTERMSVAEDAAVRLSEFRLRSGDVVIGRRGEMGRCAFVQSEQDGWLCGTGSMIVRPGVLMNGRFLQRVLSSNQAVRAIESASVGTTMINLNQRTLAELELLVPISVDEQSLIADALDDTDAVIDSLEQLLTKKRQIKQGAMQELLTGKRRLPGFAACWKDRPIKALADVQRGASPRPIDDPVWFDDSSSVGWVRISDVTQSGMYLSATTQRLSEAGIRKSRFIPSGNLIMSICATVGRPIITELNTCIHDGFVVFAALNVDKKFLYYALLNIEDDWSKHGQTGSQMNLNTGLINRTEIPVPDELEEQSAIAQVLADMDADINALESRLTKARALKQAMAQALLTGRIRLVEPTA